MEWLKGWFKAADTVVDEKVFSPVRVRILIDDLFAVLHAGVAMTPNPVDNLALEALEAKVDKDLLAHILAQRLKDLV